MGQRRASLEVRRVLHVQTMLFAQPLSHHLLHFGRGVDAIDTASQAEPHDDRAELHRRDAAHLLAAKQLVHCRCGGSNAVQHARVRPLAQLVDDELVRRIFSLCHIDVDSRAVVRVHSRPPGVDLLVLEVCESDFRLFHLVEHRRSGARVRFQDVEELHGQPLHVHGESRAARGSPLRLLLPLALRLFDLCSPLLLLLLGRCFLGRPLLCRRIDLLRLFDVSGPLLLGALLLALMVLDALLALALLLVGAAGA
mmetsp:Transcript_46708/g.144050  ORF Transcript_46708/g.144050 Transcript_46708/m.144050 type:complete len:253 (+) Transcript_46708:1264-2022(+)